jgi:hypothetical protein
MGKRLLTVVLATIVVTSQFGCDPSVAPPPKAELQVRRALLARIGRSLPAGTRVGHVTFQEQAGDVWGFEAQVLRPDGQPPLRATGTWSPGRPVQSRIEREGP